MNVQTAERTLERSTITVQRIFPAKAQGKSAHIKDVDGMMFGIWPDKLGLINEGNSYEIEFSSKVSNGTTYRDIKTVRAVAKAEPATPAPRVGPPKANDAGGNYFRRTPSGCGPVPSSTPSFQPGGSIASAVI